MGHHPRSPDLAAILAGAVLSLALLGQPSTIRAQAPEKPRPKEFTVSFDQNDPYEIVLAADRYRRELLREDLVDKAWRDIYWARAEKLYEKAFLIDPNFTYGYLSYGYSLLLSAEVLGNRPQRYKLAMGIIDKLNREDPTASLFTGQLYCIQELFEDARRSFEKAIKLGGNTSTIYAWLGYTLGSLKDDEKAQRAYEEAAGLNTDPETAQWARNQLGRMGKPWQRPPLIAPPAPRRAIQPGSVKMRLLIDDFTDHTRSLGDTAQSIARQLGTALFNNRRFVMMGRVQGEPLKGKQLQNVEAVISGGIVRDNSTTKQLILDLQAVNPLTNNMLVAKNIALKYSRYGDNIDIPPEEISKIADMIERRLPTGEGEVLYIRGRHLIVNIGSENGVQNGFTALLIGRNEEKIRSSLNGQILSKDIYLGEVVFENVTEQYSTVRLLTPGRITAKVGDLVRLK